MMRIEIKIIPEHIAYTAEYDVNDYNDFFNEETGENILVDLEELMRAENPGVMVPEIPNDYDYVTHEAGMPVTSPMHIKYYDMVNKAGKDTDKYSFVTVPEVKAAVMLHEGPFETVGETYEQLYRWIDENGYAIDGPVDTLEKQRRSSTAWNVGIRCMTSVNSLKTVGFWDFPAMCSAIRKQ